MTDRSLTVAAYLADLPDSAWSDLHGLAGDLLGRFGDTTRTELERGIAISLEVARARTAGEKTPRQARIADALAETGTAGAVALVAADWAGHAPAVMSAGR